MPRFDDIQFPNPSSLRWTTGQSAVIPIPLNFTCRTLFEAVLNSVTNQDWNLDFVTGGYECGAQDTTLQLPSVAIATMSWVPPKGIVTAVSWRVKGGTAHAGSTVPAVKQQLWARRATAAGGLAAISDISDTTAAATYHLIRDLGATGLSVAVDPTIGDRIHFYLHSESGGAARIGYTVYGLTVTMTLDSAFVLR